jgi:hypothetical protein
MLNIDNEDLIDLATACKHPALRNAKSRQPCHISALYRHVMHGARAANGERVRLETIRTPSGLRTSTEAIARFIAALTDPDRPIPTSRARRKQREAAERELQAAGFEVGGESAK